MDLSVLLPIAQALVLFHGYRLLAVRLPDNRVAVSLNALCRMLNLARNSQMKRIQRDQDLAGQLIVARIDTPRGPQYMDFLIVEAIPSWVMGLHLKRMAPEKRPLMLALKVEAIEVFHNYFFKTGTTQVSQPIAPRMQRLKQANRKIQRLPRPSQGTRAAGLAGIRAAIRRLEARLDELQERVRGIQQEQQRFQAQIQAQVQAQTQALLVTFEAFQAQTEVRVAWLEHWRRVATGAGDATLPEAEELAPLLQVKWLARLLAASIERLLEVQAQVSRLEPKPPPRAKGGRPRRDRRH